MADETPEAQPATPEPVQEPAPAAPGNPAAPVAEPAPAPSTEPQATPDPTPGATPSTSPEPSAPAAGETPATDPTQAAAAPEAAPSSTPASTPGVKAVLVNQLTRRSDEDALLGSWVDIVSGDYAGRKGAYVDDDSHDPQTGYPDRVLVRTRDAENELLTVNYSDIRPSTYTGGR